MSKTQKTGAKGRNSTIGRASRFSSRLYFVHLEGGNTQVAFGRCTAASRAL